VDLVLLVDRVKRTKGKVLTRKKDLHRFSNPTARLLLESFF